MKKVIYIILALISLALIFAFYNFYIMNKASQNFAEDLLKDVGIEMNEIENGDELAAEVIDQLIPLKDQQMLMDEDDCMGKPMGILFGDDERGRQLSLQKYLNQCGLASKNILVSVDRVDGIKLQHQIMMGSDRDHWTIVKKESSYPESPFSRMYVLVQREGNEGRMVGVSFYEGSSIEIDYQGLVNDEMIQTMTDVTTRMAQRHPEVYNKKLKEISEGPLFENDPVLGRPDLPDPDLNEEEQSTRVAYECRDSKFLQANYSSDDRVEILGYKGIYLTLRENLSKSGPRFSNADESIVFWSDGDKLMGTFLEEKGEITYDCKYQPIIHNGELRE